MTSAAMTWLQLVLVGVVALHKTIVLAKNLHEINTDIWKGDLKAAGVPDDVLEKAVFLAIHAEYEVLVHTKEVDTNEYRTYVYSRNIEDGEREELRGIRMRDAQVGGWNYWQSECNYFVLLSEGGDVYTAGCNEYNSLGYYPEAEAGDYVDTFSQVLVGMNVIQIAAGGFEVLALTQFSEVYFWGQIYGNPNDLAEVITPTMVNFDAGFIPGKLSSGSHHNLVLSKDGYTIMGWGGSDRDLYQLGLGEGGSAFVSVDHPAAAVVPDGVEFESVYAGWDISFALDVSGKLWSWGAGQWSGALGEEKELAVIREKPTASTLTADDRRVSSLKVYVKASVAIMTNGDVYQWGCYDQSLNIKKFTQVENPTETPLDLLVDMRCAHDSTAGIVALSGSNIDNCVGNNCMNGATCVNGVTYSCDCTVGYMGPTCDTAVMTDMGP